MEKNRAVFSGKVLYVLGGIPHYTAPLLEKIVLKGYQITMLTPMQKDNQVIGEGVKLIENHSTYQVKHSRVKKAWYSKSALVDLNSILLEEEPNILIIGWPYFLQLFFERSLLRTIKKGGIKLIIREIPFQVPPFGDFTFYKKNPIYNENIELQSKGIAFVVKMAFIMFVRRFIYKRADATLNYASNAYNVLPSYGIAPQSIFVTFNTSDTDSLLEQREIVESTPAFLKRRLRIIHIGRLVKWKRVDLLIDAFKLILNKYPDCELVIVGNGPEEESLKQKVISLTINERVVFAGAIYDPVVLGKYMFESTVYVLAGMGGLSINDAMSFSLPIICSECDGTEIDLVKDGVNGYFFENGNVESLASKIDLILSNPEEAKRMGNESFAVIKERINLETVSKRYVDAFDYVLKRK